MAYAAAKSGPHFFIQDDVRMIYWTITETEVGVASEFYVDVPEVCTMTLFEQELTDAGSATQVDPDLGLASGWTAGTLDEVAQNTTPGTRIRTATDVRILATGKKLYVRSTPDATADEIVTRIVLRAGHSS
jgi:hypothetical protein